MSTHFNSFTPEGMGQLADTLRADEAARLEFCQGNRRQTQQLMDRFRSERHESGRMHAQERSQFIEGLRAEGRRLREQCSAMSQERTEQSRELAREYRAAADAFHRTMRARGA